MSGLAGAGQEGLSGESGEARALVLGNDASSSTPLVPFLDADSDDVLGSSGSPSWTANGNSLHSSYRSGASGVCACRSVGSTVGRTRHQWRRGDVGANEWACCAVESEMAGERGRGEGGPRQAGDGNADPIELSSSE